MKSKIIPLLSILLVLILCLCALPSCKSRDLLARTEIASLEIDGKGRVNALITLDLRVEEAHKGEKVRFFEALPGESAQDALRRDPLDEAKIGPEMRFRFPLTAEDGRSRLYSSFYAAYESGALMFEDGFYIENPQILAQNTSDFAWKRLPKAILNPDANDAMSLSVMHAAYEVKLSELTPGADGPVAPERLDKQIREATDSGMQVSLFVTPDTPFSATETVAAMEMLSARYAGGENGLITAIFLRAVDVNSMPTLCRLTSLALRSHVANGRVYAVAPSASFGETQSFFENLRLAFAASGEITWGAAVSPQPSDSLPWEDASEDAMSVANLASLSAALSSAPDEGRSSHFALCDVAYSAEDQALQAACFAYTYFSAVSANAGLVFYRDHLNDATGLRDENGEAHRILSVMKQIDSGLNTADRRMCEQLVGEAWSELDRTDPLRASVSGTASVGTMGLQEDALFDFSGGDTLGFVGAGALEAPKSHPSASWNQPVLYTWIDPTYHGESGVRKVLRGEELPKNANSLSVHLLTQLPSVEECSVTLRLEGTSVEGEHLTYEKSIRMPAGKWQSVTFGISSFSTELDHSMPCIMTLSTEPLSETDQDYALWIRGINARSPERDMSAILAIGIVLGCVTVGFLIVFLIYRCSAPAPRRAKRRR